MSPYILRFTVDSSVIGGTPRAAFPTHCVQRQLSGIADAQRAPLQYAAEKIDRHRRRGRRPTYNRKAKG